jgi:hypothetical protein
MTALGQINSQAEVQEATPGGGGFHSAGPDTQGLWQFDGDLVADGVGNDLSLNVGVLRFGPAAVPTARCVSGNGATTVTQAHDATLQIAGALTVQFLLRIRAPATAFVAQPIVIFAGAGGGSTNNAQYNIRLAAVTPAACVLSYNHEFGSLSPVDWDVTGIMLPVGQWTHIALTRESDGVTVTFFVNGIEYATSVLSNPPDGGSTGFLSVLGFQPLGDFVNADVSSLRIDDAVVSDADILANARLLLPDYLRP